MSKAKQPTHIMHKGQKLALRHSYPLWQTLSRLIRPEPSSTVVKDPDFGPEKNFWTSDKSWEPGILQNLQNFHSLWTCWTTFVFMSMLNSHSLTLSHSLAHSSWEIFCSRKLQIFSVQTLSIFSDADISKMERCSTRRQCLQQFLPYSDTVQTARR